MNRYTDNKIKIDKDGKRVYETTYYPQIPLGNADTFITAKIGTRIDNLASQYYGDSSLWWIIANANGFKGKVVFKPGDFIRIPSDVQDILEKFKELNR